MAAPSATPRVTPVGRRLRDGYQTLITFERDPDVSLWEISVTPPGVDGGDAVDTFTMHSVDWRTMGARQLKTLTESSFVAAYDPAVLTQLIELVNVETVVTVTFPDGSTWAYYGYLRVFEPNEITEGEQPTANCTIQPTNEDPVNDVEAGPTVVSVPGT